MANGTLSTKQRRNKRESRVNDIVKRKKNELYEKKANDLCMGTLIFNIKGYE